MRLLLYMGHHHNAWCFWQGNSTGWKLRIGFKREEEPWTVFYISGFGFHFHISKEEIGEKFRYIRFFSCKPIYFSSKNTRTIDSLRTQLFAAQNNISDLYRKHAKLNDIEKKCDERMREMRGLYASTIRLDEDYQIEDRIEVSLKEELYGREFHCPHQKRLVKFRKN